MELSKERPTQLTEIPVNQADFEDLFLADTLSWGEQVEQAVNHILMACQALMDKRFVMMKNKRVWYDRDVAALYPKLDQVAMPYCKSTVPSLEIYQAGEGFDTKENVLHVDDITFHLATPQEAATTFHQGNGNPYVAGNGVITNYAEDNYSDTVFIADDYYYNNSYLRYHGTNGYSDTYSRYSSRLAMLMIMIAWLDGKDSQGLSPARTLHAWLQHGLIPDGLEPADEPAYVRFLEEYQKIDNYLDWDSQDDYVFFRKDAFVQAVGKGEFRQTVFQRRFDLAGIIEDCRQGTMQYTSTLSFLREELLNWDYRRANLEPYADSVLSDINIGHWELFEAPEENAISVVPSGQVWTARPPQLDVVASGTCAIDFGTKSTVVVCRNQEARLLRVGTGDYTKAAKKEDYENPTVIELRDLTSFEQAYQQRPGRPFTTWEEITVSHQAESALLQEDIDSSVYYAVFSELKQWAHEKDRRLLLKDRKGVVWKLDPYLTLADDAFDPIEIYAYYLGLYINNMRHGIYLDYILSFPVNYDLAVRKKLLQSFERGLKKSLPSAILADEDLMKRFRVYAGASEPAAYAAAALKAYGLEPKETGDMTAYGVFDFGGGTTDFDFGIEKLSANPRRCKFELHQFGRGGDPYLGGENILNHLAFDVYCANLDTMRKESIPIALPHGCTAPAGTETLILADREATQISFMNRKSLAEALRPLWEGKSEAAENLKDNQLNLSLFVDTSRTEKEANQNRKNVNLTIDTDHLKDVIRSLISRGVTNFFQAWQEAFKNREEMPDHIHIFLAGNSCRSPIVKELFDEQIKAKEEDISAHSDGKQAEGLFILHLPLGMEEGEADPNEELDRKLTGKTGVAFGLLRSRKGGKDVKIINANVDASGEALFPYFLGDIDIEGHFHVRIGKQVPYQSWAAFCYADEEDFEIYYTSEPQAIENQMPPEAVKHVNCRIEADDVSDADDTMIYIRKVNPDTIEYAVGTEGDFSQEDCVKQKHIIRQTLR
ncbi:hypothetical protein H6A05_10425 [Megasphaera elsdenii]|uniref:hypothetical protein n=1 Tax=Megasphaera elsdenii TaxID=907 RepID=UPI001959589A|nr:hypothetical protein [Megasphaera elsdenii]MBM6702694.1 hypothetical protein [Megasphaera elsdenii]